jgi:hypothetical protein
VAESREAERRGDPSISDKRFQVEDELARQVTLSRLRSALARRKDYKQWYNQ